MKRGAALALAGVALLFFALIAHAIISVKLFELRIALQRDRILNLELSSQALRARAKRLAFGRQDFQAEIRQSALESNLLNERAEGAPLRPIHYVGLAAVSGARLLLLKSPPDVADDYRTTVLMRYAFYLERNRRYPNAIERYNDLLKTIGDGQSDVHAFAHLHLGYCLASIGEMENARSQLRLVDELYPATHFSDTARTLLALLEEGQRRRERIQAEASAPLERARGLFQNGQCPAALAAFEAAAQTGPALSPMDRYRRALCLEETGAANAAIDDYRALAAQSADVETARLANRRLLIIGIYYEGGRDLTEQAGRRAYALGDDAAAREITSVATLRQSAQVLEEIETLRASADALGGALHQNLVTELGESAGELRRVPEELASPEPVRQLDVLAGLPLPEPNSAAYYGQVRVELRDGQRRAGRELVFSAVGVNFPGETPIPLELVAAITAEPAGPGQPGILEVGLPAGAAAYADRLKVERGAVILEKKTGGFKLDAASIRRVRSP